ncbi:hypothetical protein M3P05_00265 [Sansalvadorimonas sp. 2012CJ34-2]|uniref:Penicillin-binding protein activator LpoB n=1 Tax=Parendozoicomonas callyspongiae TaxID=2942213 RepID=A0ABT0PAH0_9GAMM|nr:hypothetical protein [Sansalvadorimonas sp. 2012CJ34-2]MCL6268382.1 hypothetical protein [Sansalvadorimonas sp. 2012CJ34-2]
MKPIQHTLLALTFAVAAGCSSTPYQNGFPSQENWAVMPAISLNSEEAGIQLERMLKVLLASNGVENISQPPQTEFGDQSTLISNAHKLQNANQWAQQHAVKLGMIGSVDEWKTSSDGRFTVGLTLKLTDIETGEVVWTTSGQGEGRPQEDPLDVTRNLINTLLSTLPITGSPAESDWLDWFKWIPGV